MHMEGMEDILLKLMLADVNSFLGSFAATEGVPDFRYTLVRCYPVIHAIGRSSARMKEG